VLGSTAELLEIRQWRLSQGSFLPPGDPTDANPVCVIGNKVARELFGAQPAIGQWLRIADRRFRVIGILQTEGRSIGLDVEELLIVPVASAQALFNTPSLFRILVEASSRESIARARDFILATVIKRHQGEEDITVVTQDAVLATFDRIFRALTLTVAGIAGISLAVAGILVMNIMLVSVTQRTVEIGLLKAIGASGGHIVTLFMTEAALLSMLGGLAGLTLGMVGAWALGRIYPALPTGAPPWAIVMALVVALGTGLLFGILPARRAGRLDPITALSRR
jgi:putative ABC transport system permease protein